MPGILGHMDLSGHFQPAVQYSQRLTDLLGLLRHSKEHGLKLEGIVGSPLPSGEQMLPACRVLYGKMDVSMGSMCPEMPDTMMSVSAT